MIRLTGAISVSLRSISLGSAAVGAVLSASPAFAQAVPQTEASSVDTIVVTASRARSEFQAPTPTVIMGTAQLEQRGATNVAQLLYEQPQFGQRFGNAAVGSRATGAGSNFVDLRNLNPHRTLVLVDGRRFVPTPTDNVQTPYQVDLNLIPSQMIERIEVVTGGASAQWGSDAIAGVTNLILKKRMNGLQGELQGGISQRSDMREFRLGLAGGFDFAGGKGHLVAGGDIVENNGILGDYQNRDWWRNSYAVVPDATANVANGRPRNVIVPDVRFGNLTSGGLIVNTAGMTTGQAAALLGTEFLAGGTTRPFQRGDYNPATTPTTFSASQVGGGNAGLTPYTGVSMVPATKRQVFSSHGEYQFTPSLTAFLDVSYGRVQGKTFGRPLQDTGAVSPTGTAQRIQADNAYLPAQIRALMPAGSSFVLNRVSLDIPANYTTVEPKTWRGVFGLQGNLGGTWTWNAFYGYGKTDFTTTQYNGRNRDNYSRAVDAVLNSANGQVVCRSTLTSPTNGCVPINLFGNGSPSATAIAYTTRTVQNTLRYHQQTAALNVQGEPFSTWAGPVSVAGGLEWRREFQKQTYDTITLSEGTASNYGGSFKVPEEYAEAIVPLAKDMALAKSLVVNGAYRHANYGGQTGGANTWKIGSTYQPFDGLLLRAARSLDIRAPSLFELNLPSRTATGGQVVFQGLTVSPTQISSGNKNLKAEKSYTTTFGAALTPRFLRGFNFSADYFKITINGAVALSNAGQTVDFCAQGVQNFCNNLTVVNGSLTQIQLQFINFTKIVESGWDFAANYDREIGPGHLNVRGNATYVHQLDLIVPSTAPGGGLIITHRAGDNSVSQSSVPRFRGNLAATYSIHRASVTGNMIVYGRGEQNPAFNTTGTATTPPDILNNTVKPYFLFALSGTYWIDKAQRFQLFGVINNLFDSAPPVVPSTALSVQTNPANYDEIGRYFRAGVRFKF